MAQLQCLNYNRFSYCFQIMNAKNQHYRRVKFAFTQSQNSLPRQHQHIEFENIIEQKKIYQMLIKNELNKLQTIENAEQIIIEPFQDKLDAKYIAPQGLTEFESKHQVLIQQITLFRRQKKAKSFLKRIKDHWMRKRCRNASIYFHYEHSLKKVFSRWKQYEQNDQHEKIPLIKQSLIKMKKISFLKKIQIPDLTTKQKIYNQMIQFRRYKKLLSNWHSSFFINKHSRQCQKMIRQTKLGIYFQYFTQYFKEKTIMARKKSLLSNIQKHRNFRNLFELYSRSKIASIAKCLKPCQTIKINCEQFGQEQKLFQINKKQMLAFFQNKRKKEVFKYLLFIRHNFCFNKWKIEKQIHFFFTQLQDFNQNEKRIKQIVAKKAKLGIACIASWWQNKKKFRTINKKKKKYEKMREEWIKRELLQNIRQMIQQHKKLSFTTQILKTVIQQKQIHSFFNSLRCKDKEEPSFMSELSFQLQVEKINKIKIKSWLKLLQRRFEASKQYQGKDQNLLNSIKNIQKVNFFHKIKLLLSRVNMNNKLDIIKKIIVRNYGKRILSELQRKTKIAKTRQTLAYLRSRQVFEELGEYQQISQKIKTFTSLIANNEMKKVFQILKMRRIVNSSIIQKQKQLKKQIRNDQIESCFKYWMSKNQGLKKIQFVRAIVIVNKYKHFSSQIKLSMIQKNQKQQSEILKILLKQKRVKLFFDHLKHNSTSKEQSLMEGIYKEHNFNPLFNQSSIQYKQEEQLSIDQQLQSNNQEQVQQAIQSSHSWDKSNQLNKIHNDFEPHSEVKSIEPSSEQIGGLEEYLEDDSSSNFTSFEDYRIKNMEKLMNNSQTEVIEYAQQIQQTQKMIQKKAIVRMANNYQQQCRIRACYQYLQQQKINWVFVSLKTYKITKQRKKKSIVTFFQNLHQQSQYERNKATYKNIIKYHEQKKQHNLKQVSFNALKYLKNGKQKKEKKYTEEDHSTMRKVFEGLKMFGKQKKLLKLFLREYDTVSYYPQSQSQHQAFLQIAH